MTAPTAPIDICNLALNHLGNSTSIGSIETPTTTLESTFALVYDTQRRKLLREHPWNFAKRFDVIARTDDGDTDYSDHYTLPSDCLRVLSVGGDDDSSYYTDFDIKGRSIYVNAGGATSLNLRYVSNVDEVSNFDPLFIHLLSLYIAKVMAYPITKKASVVAMIAEMIREEKQLAMSVDGQERPPKRISRSPALARRRMGNSSVADGYTRFYSD